MADSGYSVGMMTRNSLIMVRLLLGFLGSWFRSKNDLVLENFALRQQLAVFKQKQPRPRLSRVDRALLGASARAEASAYGDPLLRMSDDAKPRSGSPVI